VKRQSKNTPTPVRAAQPTVSEKSVDAPFEGFPKLYGLGEPPKQTPVDAGGFEGDEDYKEWRKRIKEIERKILGFNKFKNNLYLLERIEAKGASREKIINILAIMVSSTPRGLDTFAAKKRDELDRLSRALFTVARQTERALSDPWSYSSTWFCSYFDPNEEIGKPYFPDKERLYAAQHMKRWGNALKAEARKLGFLMRKGGAHHARNGTVTILGYIRKTTKTDFDAEMAQLLTIAFEAVGISRRYPAETLRKIRERHVMHNLDNPTP
jgi:hypothetical protein